MTLPDSLLGCANPRLGRCAVRPSQVPTGPGRLGGVYNPVMRCAYHTSLTDLVSACCIHYSDRLVSVAVLGSVGRGTPSFDSDIDLLIVAEGLPLERFPRVGDFRSVEETLAPRLQAVRQAGSYPELSPIFKTRAELALGTPLLLDMTEDAMIRTALCRRHSTS